MLEDLLKKNELFLFPLAHEPSAILMEGERVTVIDRKVFYDNSDTTLFQVLVEGLGEQAWVTILQTWGNTISIQKIEKAVGENDITANG